MKTYTIEALADSQDFDRGALFVEASTLTAACEIIETLEGLVKIHLPPVFDDNCEGCRTSTRETLKTLATVAEMKKKAGL